MVTAGQGFLPQMEQLLHMGADVSIKASNGWWGSHFVDSGQDSLKALNSLVFTFIQDSGWLCQTLPSEWVDGAAQIVPVSVLNTMAVVALCDSFNYYFNFNKINDLFWFSTTRDCGYNHAESLNLRSCHCLGFSERCAVLVGLRWIRTSPQRVTIKKRSCWNCTTRALTMSWLTLTSSWTSSNTSAPPAVMVNYLNLIIRCLLCTCVDYYPNVLSISSQVLS